MTSNPPLKGEPQVGRRVDRLESIAKVTGAADYTHNLELPRMLHAKLVRSPHAHARILGIDTREAAAMPGVFMVVTAREVMRLIPDPHYGPAFHDQPILAIDRVRHVGEPVAVVLASDPHAAEAAAGVVAVDYERLPAVFDEVEAATSNVLVHDVLKPAGTSPTSSTWPDARARTWHSTTACATATWTRPSPRPRTCSTTPSGPSR